MPYANVNGTKLYYEVKGKGPAMVLIHGWTLDTAMWDPQFDEFSKQYKVLRYDLRGYGKSAPKNYEPFTHHDDLKALMNYLKIDHAAIIGLSMGGTIAINFTLTYPERASALITVDSSIENCTSPHMAAFNKSMTPIFSKGKAESIESARKYWMMMPLFSAANRNPRCASKLKEIVGRYNGWDFVNDDKIVPLNPIPEKRLHEIKVPTIVVIGELDDPGFQDIARIISSGVKGSQKVTMKGVGHMSNMENPEEFNKIVLDFLKNHVN